MIEGEMMGGGISCLILQLVGVTVSGGTDSLSPAQKGKIFQLFHDVSPSSLAFSSQLFSIPKLRSCT